jgi:hypothetical protein
MRKILSFKDFGLYEYAKFDSSLYQKINEANFLDPVEKKKHDPEAFKKMRASVFFLNGQYPFFGSLLSRLIIRENLNLRHKTMATDGISIHYDPQYIHDHTEEELMWVVAHEVLHNALLHFLRAPKDRTKLIIWNVATDYAINQMLTPIDPSSSPDQPKPTSKKSDCVGTMPEGALYPGCKYVPYDHEFVGQSADTIYNTLIARGFQPDPADDPSPNNTPPPPPPPPAPDKLPNIGDIIYDPINDNYGVVNSVDLDNDEVDYDPIPKEKVPEYLKRKSEGK